jgi:hypothetical protein
MVKSSLIAYQPRPAKTLEKMVVRFSDKLYQIFFCIPYRVGKANVSSTMFSANAPPVLEEDKLAKREQVQSSAFRLECDFTKQAKA